MRARPKGFKDDRKPTPLKDTNYLNKVELQAACELSRQMALVEKQTWKPYIPAEIVQEERDRLDKMLEDVKRLFVRHELIIKEAGDFMPIFYNKL